MYGTHFRIATTATRNWDKLLEHAKNKQLCALNLRQREIIINEFADFYIPISRIFMFYLFDDFLQFSILGISKNSCCWPSICENLISAVCLFSRTRTVVHYYLKLTNVEYFSIFLPKSTYYGWYFFTIFPLESKKRDKYRRKGQGRRCYLGDRIY